MEYTGRLESTGGNNAAFVIPDDEVEALNAGRRPNVRVTVIADSITSAKKPETRQRRIAKAAETLRSGRS